MGDCGSSEIKKDKKNQREGAGATQQLQEAAKAYPDIEMALHSGLSQGDIRAFHLEHSRIVRLPDLSYFFNLERLFLTGNELSDFKSIAVVRSLVVLHLGHNRIRTLEGIEPLIHLQELYLNDNSLERIAHLETLAQLKVLDLHGNALRAIQGLDNQAQLTELNLARNQIGQLPSLDYLPKLARLHLSHNPLSEQENSQGLGALKKRGVTVVWTSS